MKRVIWSILFALSLFVLGCGTSFEPVKYDAELSEAYLDIVKGTYIGEDDSVLIINDGGVAKYYHTSWDNVEECSWTIENEKIVWSSVNLKSDIYAVIANGSADELYFVSDSESNGWLSEGFEKVSSEPIILGAEEYRKYIEEHRLSVVEMNDTDEQIETLDGNEEEYEIIRYDEKYDLTKDYPIDGIEPEEMKLSEFSTLREQPSSSAVRVASLQKGTEIFAYYAVDEEWTLVEYNKVLCFGKTQNLATLEEYDELVEKERIASEEKAEKERQAAEMTKGERNVTSTSSNEDNSLLSNGNVIVEEQVVAPIQSSGGGLCWLPASGTNYHSKNNCGRMNPDRATQVSVDEAISLGYSRCSKCW